MPTTTGYSLPLTITSNGTTTGNAFTDPNDILLPDGVFANSQPGSGVASDITVGNFDWLNGGIPSDAVITGFEIQLIAKRGAQTVPPITVTLYAVDNTSGTDIFYPYTSPYSGLTLTNTSHYLGSSTYMFATTWTGVQAQNFKLQLVSNGDINVDTVLVNVHYYVPTTPVDPTPVIEGCLDCNSPIQVQAMYLELPFLSGETKFYLKKGNYTYPDGTPVQVGDVGVCGGTVDFVFDKNKRKENGQNFAENVQLPYDPDDVNTPTWTVLPSGVVEVDIKTITNRGLKFYSPYDHDANLMSDHDANSEVIISNSAPFYARFVRRCEVDLTFAPPIEVQDEGATITPSAHVENFTGGGVQVIIPDPLLPNNVEIIIPGSGTMPPTVVDSVSGSSDDVQVLTLTLPDLSVEGVNRGVVYQISTEQAATVVSVIGNGSENFVQQVVETDAGNNIRTEQWFLIAPTAGLMTIEVTMSAIAYISHGAESLVGVDQATPTGTVSNDQGTSAAPSTANVTTFDSSLVFDSLATALLPIVYTAGLNQTLNWDETANPIVRQGASSYQFAGTAPDNVIMNWTMTQNTDWCMTSLEIKGITSTPPVVSALTVQDETASTVVPNVVKIVVPDTHLNSPLATEADITFQNVLETVSQTGHGFSIGDVIQSSAVDGEYQLAQADNAANSEVNGIVTEVIDIDTFVIVTEGFAILTSLPGGAVAGDILYLDDAVAGGLTLTAPSAAGTIVHKLGQVIDAATFKIDFHNYLGLTQDQVNAGGGSGSEKKVGVGDTTDIDWFNTQYLFFGIDGSGQFGVWDLTGSFANLCASALFLADNDKFEANSTDYDFFLPDFDDIGGELTFDSGKQIIFQSIVTTSAVDATNRGGIGFTGFGGTSIVSASATNTLSIGFVRNAAGQWYARTGTGAAFTETAITIPTGKNTLRCEYDPLNATPQARFYVDGVLLATITTNLPTANGSVIGFSGGNSGNANSNAFEIIGAPSFSVEV